MVYVLVLLGSLFGICIIAGARLLLKQRSVRRFVRSLRQRMQYAEERGALMSEETRVVKPTRTPRASAIEMQQVRMLVRSAEKAWKQNRLDEVERVLIQALTIQPHAHEVRAELGKLYLTTDRENKAEAMYKELLLHRNDVSFHANLGLSYYKQGKYIEACHAYQNALNLEPKNPERSAALGRACIAAHRFEDAAPLLEKACMLLSRDISLLHMLAECYLQLDQKDKAMDAYTRIHRLEPYDETVKAKIQALRSAQGEGVMA